MLWLPNSNDNYNTKQPLQNSKSIYTSYYIYIIRRKPMKLKNTLVVVKDIEKSKEYYRNLFGLDPIPDNGGSIIQTEIW